MADYELEVTLIDGHTLTVTATDQESAFLAATNADMHVVKNVRAKLTGVPPCPLCRDSGIELRGVRLHPGLGGAGYRRIVCECARGRELLERTGDGGRLYPEVQHHLDEPEAVARPRTDGRRGWEGESFGTVEVDAEDPCPCGGAHVAADHDMVMAAEAGGEG